MCPLTSQESGNSAFCSRILHWVLAIRKHSGLDLLTTWLETARWAGGTELLPPLLAQGHYFLPQASHPVCLPAPLGDLSYA